MEMKFVMYRLEERNQKMINAVIAKAERECPGAIALVAVCGSFANGDFYEKSDLDLLVLANDDAGQAVSTLFIQDDLGVAHDIYCTSWKRLEDDAKYEHPNLAKLLDSQIIWSAAPKYRERLQHLRDSARAILDAPFSREDFDKAARYLREAEQSYAKAMCADTIHQTRANAVLVLHYIQYSLMLLNKRYYRLGVRRLYDELSALEKRPLQLCELLEAVLSADAIDTLKSALTALLRKTEAVFDTAEAQFQVEKEPATADNLRGTYEEMFSNWRNKMYLAAETGNRSLAFLTMGSLDAMLREIAESVDIAAYESLSGYDPNDLWKTAEFFDKTIENYLDEYQKSGLAVRRYADIDEFVKDYLK